MLLAAWIAPVLAAATPAPPPSPPVDAAPARKVELAGRSYRFPASEPAYSTHFGDSAEIRVPEREWYAMLARVAPLHAWQTARPDETVLVYLTRPGVLHQWEKGKPPGAPPVRERVVRQAVRGNMAMWASRGAFGAQDLVYITYADKPDIYVRCDRIALGDPTAGCDLLWFDSGVVHVLGLAADWLRHAPAQAAEYERAVRLGWGAR